MTELESWDALITRRRAKSKIPLRLNLMLGELVKEYGIRKVSREIEYQKLRLRVLNEIAKRRVQRDLAQ
jgi:hypothetical protein